MNIKVSGNSEQKSEIPKTLLEALGACDMDSFPSIHFLLVVGCTLLISSAEAERSFSLMRKIKTYARSVMTEECFSDLALISMHYKERVPADEICKAFVQAHPRNCFKHPYLTIVVHRSSNSYNRNLINTTQFYVVFCP